MPTVPTTRWAIQKAIDEDGPLAAVEMTEATGLTRKSINGAVHLMRKKKMLHIVDWKRNLGTGGVFAPIYANGDGPDKPKPKLDPVKEAQQRYREKMRQVSRAKLKLKRGKEPNRWLQILGL